MNSNNNGLTFAIVFASIAVSGSLVFFGLQMKGDAMEAGDLQAAIRSGIDDYVEEVAAEAAQPSQPAAPAVVEGDFTDDDAVFGDEDAPVTIVEFSDYQCPYCAKFYRETLPQIKANYVETGKAKLVYRDYPLSFHPEARPAAMFAECARAQGGDEVYFEVHDKIFENYSLGQGFNFDSLSGFAATLGVDAGELKECYDNEEFDSEITDDLNDGAAAGISGTPGFLINGRRVSGAQPYSVFETAIEDALSDQ